jgi:predicted PurR-regulated permease PerM
MYQNRYMAFAGTFFLITAWMLKDFLPGLVWGAVFAISLWPLFNRATAKFGEKLKNPAMLFALVFIIVFVLPLAYVGYDIAQLYSAGNSFLTRNAQGVIPVPAFISVLPFASNLSELWVTHISSSTGAIATINKISGNQLTSWVTTLALQLSTGFVTALVMMVSFYFMLKNGDFIKKHYAETLTHWFSEKSVSVVDRGVAALRGTINGVILLGLIEGVLLAIPLVLGGVKSGMLFGLIAGLLGVIPMVMPVIIVPSIVYLYFSGEVTYAVIMAVDLGLVWLLFENVIKPNLISGASKVNPYLVLLGLIGGLKLLGPVGLFIGPAIVAMTVGMAKDLVIQKQDFPG